MSFIYNDGYKAMILTSAICGSLCLLKKELFFLFYADRTIRKEDNYQESIQLPNTFHTRHQRERRTHLKTQSNGTTIKTQQSESQKDSCFLKTNDQTAIQNKTFTRTYMQRHTMTEIVNHMRSATLELSVKT